MVFTKSLTWTFSGSYVTVIFSVAKFTSAFTMPLSPVTPFSIFAAQDAQLIPVMGRLTVLRPALFACDFSFISPIDSGFLSRNFRGASLNFERQAGLQK